MHDECPTYVLNRYYLTNDLTHVTREHKLQQEACRQGGCHLQLWLTAFHWHSGSKYNHVFLMTLCMGT